MFIQFQAKSKDVNGNNKLNYVCLELFLKYKNAIIRQALYF